jgi:NhaP-type Na+/H+ and K+/H+ antiporter
VELNSRRRAVSNCTLNDVLHRRLGDELESGTSLRLSMIDLIVRDMVDDSVEQVGLVIRVDSDSAAARPAREAAD